MKMSEGALEARFPGEEGVGIAPGLTDGADSRDLLLTTMNPPPATSAKYAPKGKAMKEGAQGKHGVDGEEEAPPPQAGMKQRSAAKRIPRAKGAEKSRATTTGARGKRGRDERDELPPDQVGMTRKKRQRVNDVGPILSVNAAGSHASDFRNAIRN